MTTEKRDKLASTSAMVVPMALDEVRNALRLVEEGNFKASELAMQNAEKYLEIIVPLFSEACAEVAICD